jgi:acetyltransferase
MPMSAQKSSSAPGPASAPSCAHAAQLFGSKEILRARGYGKLLLRPIQPDDESLLVEFHRGLSEESIHSRYFEQMSLENRIGHERLKRICTNDAGSFALVAEYPGTAKKPREILGIGRLSVTDDPSAADFALLVADKAHGHGIGSALVERLTTLARACGFKRLTGEVLVANHEMIHVCHQSGFTTTRLPEGTVAVSCDL